MQEKSLLPHCVLSLIRTNRFSSKETGLFPGALHKALWVPQLSRQDTVVSTHALCPPQSCRSSSLCLRCFACVDILSKAALIGCSMGLMMMSEFHSLHDAQRAWWWCQSFIVYTLVLWCTAPRSLAALIALHPFLEILCLGNPLSSGPFHSVPHQDVSWMHLLCSLTVVLCWVS